MLFFFSFLVHMIPSRRGRDQGATLALPYGVAQDEEGDKSQCRYPVDADPEGKGGVERLVAQCDDEGRDPPLGLKTSGFSFQRER